MEVLPGALTLPTTGTSGTSRGSGSLPSDSATMTAPGWGLDIWLESPPHTLLGWMDPGETDIFCPRPQG